MPSSILPLSPYTCCSGHLSHSLPPLLLLNLICPCKNLPCLPWGWTLTLRETLICSLKINSYVPSYIIVILVVFPCWFCHPRLSVQCSSVAQLCPAFCDPMNHSMPGLPVHHQLPDFTQTHAHWVSDAIQPSHSLSSPCPPAPNPS